MALMWRSSPARRLTMTAGRSSDPAAEFRSFLHVAVVEEADTMPVSMLSALARLNIDPWEEAEVLARLPREVAARRLASSLAKLPGGLQTRTDAEAACLDWIMLLPVRSNDLGRGQTPASRPMLPETTLWVVIITLLLVSFYQAQTQPAERGTSRPSGESPARAAAAAAAAIGR